jgi:hypothetical protein
MGKLGGGTSFMPTRPSTEINAAGGSDAGLLPPISI